MTRINTIHPSHLLDQHLMAEYREIAHVPMSLRRSLRSKSWNYNKIPREYTLNMGHVTFFYNKKEFLYNRFQELVMELIDRGVNIDIDNKFIDWSQFDYLDQVSWIPEFKDHEINMDRILERFRMKPNWYKYKSEMIDYTSYYNLLKEEGYIL